MPIQSGDVKLLKSAVMADVPEGGGAPTGNTIADGVSNAIFPDISELDRAGGRVNLRKSFVSVQADDTDTYFGANVIVAEPPQDARVSVTLFSTEKTFDTREQAQVRIEAYLNKGPEWAGYLFENHIAGQRVIQLFQRTTDTVPNVGQTLVLIENEGLGTQKEQYIRATSVSVVERTFTYDGDKDYKASIVTVDISDALRYDFTGSPASRTFTRAANSTKTRDTVVADAGTYVGVVPLTQAAAVGDFTIKGTSIYTQLVPSAQTETPISFVPPYAAAGLPVPGAVAVSYTASHELYHSSRKDDNTDHILAANAQFAFDARNRVRLNAGYRKMEETASADQQIENDKYNTTNVGAGYTYGADSATGQIRLGVSHDRLRYDNSYRFDDGSRLNAGKERDSTSYVGTFLYRVAPKTKALIEARHTQHDYVSNKALDSNNNALLVGAEWEATAFTTGSVKLGRERKDFDLASKGDASTGMWEVGVTWAPLTYSTFSLNTRAGFDEGSDGADAIETQSTTLAWNHNWSQRVSSTVSYTRTDQDYDRPGNPREDNIDTFGVGVTYKLRRWLDVGIGYKHAENDSTQDGKSYKRNTYGLTLNASL